jgi:hypothetical protein
MPLLTIVMSDPVPPGRPLLLAPRIVDAFGFRCDGLEVEHGAVVDEIKASNSGQRAFVVRPTAAPQRPVLRYRLRHQPPGRIARDGTQLREIAEMRLLLDDIARNGEQGDRDLPARSAELTPEIEAEAREVLKRQVPK